MWQLLKLKSAQLQNGGKKRQMKFAFVSPRASAL